MLSRSPAPQAPEVARLVVHSLHGLHDTLAVQPQNEASTSDLRLLYQWLTLTSGTLAASRESEGYWRDVFPQIGFTHDFVMQAILSLAAMHLAYMHPDERPHFLHTAMRHNAVAVRGMSDSIDRLDNNMAEAVFVAASLNIVYVLCAYGPIGNAGEAEAPNDRAYRLFGGDWISMVRGVEAVLSPVYDQLRKGALAHMLNISAWESADPDATCAPGDEHFCHLQAAWCEDNEREMYTAELQRLRKCHAYMHEHLAPSAQTRCNGLSSGPIIWLHFCSETFLRRLYERRQPALLLYAYFGALWNLMDGLWFAQGWAKDIIETTSEVLGGAWAGWLAWPREIVGLNPKFR